VFGAAGIDVSTIHLGTFRVQTVLDILPKTISDIWLLPNMQQSGK